MTDLLLWLMAAGTILVLIDRIHGGPWLSPVEDDAWPDATLDALPGERRGAA